MTDTPKKGSLVKLAYDYWDEEGTRNRAGATVKLPAAEVKALLKEGKAERADPLPED